MTAAAAVVAGVAGRGTLVRTAGMVWRAWGNGRPLLLLHGGSGSWTHWIRNVEPLAARFRVLAPDMPGFGDAGAIEEPHTAEGLADAVVAGLRTVAPASLDIAGFSLGGIVSGLVAARLGTRVRTLVLIGPAGLGLPGGTLPALVRVPTSARPDEIEAVHRENLRRLMFARAEAADDLAVHVQTENLRRARFKTGTIPVSDVLLRALPSVRARIAGIWGAHDVYAGPHVALREKLLATFQPGLDFRVFDAGHWVVYEAAGDVNAALAEMLVD